jgi:hypothetical protein
MIEVHHHWLRCAALTADCSQHKRSHHQMRVHVYCDATRSTSNNASAPDSVS